jgi:hypothetical protein
MRTYGWVYQAVVAGQDDQDNQGDHGISMEEKFFF